MTPWVKVFFIYPGEEKPSEVNKMNNVLKTTFLLSLLTILLVAMGCASA
jgi:hypothetical protein